MGSKMGERGNYMNPAVAKGEVILYRAKDGRMVLDVRLQQETVWLNQKQMSTLFDKDVRTVNEHIQNIFKEKELPAKSVIRKFRITAADGKVYATNFYNLDVIISVGYRVKSKRGTQFRIWATKVLKDYLIRGFALNQKRLAENQDKFKELQRTIAFIKNKSAQIELQGQTQELLSIIHQYARSLSLFYQYDKGTLAIRKGRKPHFVLRYEASKGFIGQIKAELTQKGEANNLFGQETGHKFESIIGTIYQTFDKNDLYPSIEEKAANLLYLIIKDHPFVDGNKRIASLLFLYFLDKNDYLWKDTSERKITDNTMVALALLIANSEPREKAIMIKIITNLLRDERGGSHTKTRCKT